MNFIEKILDLIFIIMKQIIQEDTALGLVEDRSAGNKMGKLTIIYREADRTILSEENHQTP